MRGSVDGYGRDGTYGVVPSDEGDDDVAEHEDGTCDQEGRRESAQSKTEKKNRRRLTFEIVGLSILNSPVDDENREEESDGFEEVEPEVKRRRTRGSVRDWSKRVEFGSEEEGRTNLRVNGCPMAHPRRTRTGMTKRAI